MYEKMINASILTYLIGAAVFVFAQRFILYTQEKIGTFLVKSFAGKKKNEVIDEANRIGLELAKNIQFLKDLAKIIIEEGGLKKFIQKTKTDFDSDIMYWYNFDDEGMMQKDDGNLYRIVKKVLELPSVKKEIKNSYYEDKKLLTQKIGNTIWVFLAHRDFKQNLENTLDEIGLTLKDINLTK